MNPAITDGASADSEPGLFAVTVAALQSTGRLVSMDVATETFEVPSPDAARDPVLGVVLRHSGAVVFYAVRDTAVPAEHRPAVADLVLRANTDLFTSTLEFDTDTGILSVRAGVLVGSLAIAPPTGIDGVELPAGPALSRQAYATLMTQALTEVESVSIDYAGAIEAVVQHGSSPLIALAELRRPGAPMSEGPVQQ